MFCGLCLEVWIWTTLASGCLVSVKVRIHIFYSQMESPSERYLCFPPVDRMILAMIVVAGRGDIQFIMWSEPRWGEGGRLAEISHCTRLVSNPSSSTPKTLPMDHQIRHVVI